MRKCCWFLGIMALGLFACSKQEKSIETLATKAVYQSYDATDALCFTVDDEGVVYVPQAEEILAYGLEGEVLHRYPLPMVSRVYNLCYGDGKLYIDGSDTSSRGLWCLDLNSESVSEVTSLHEYSSIRSLHYQDGAIYICGQYSDAQPTHTESSDYDTQHYESRGLVLTKYSLETGETEVVFRENIDSCSIRPDGVFVIFAHDEEGGYYFAALENGFTGEYERLYTPDLTYMMSFCATEDGLIYAGQNEGATSNHTDLYYREWASEGWASVMPNVSINPGNNILYCKGHTYYLNSPTSIIDLSTLFTRVERIRNSVYVKESATIQAISSKLLYTDLFSGGYRVKETTLDVDKFVLSVLSNDSDHDLFFLSSLQDIAHNIRDNGNFYPLNDVPGVMEYLEDCFPYIKEAATDAEGNIWMLPVTIDIPISIIQKQNSEDKGFLFWEDQTVFDAIDRMLQLQEADVARNTFDFAYRAYPQYCFAEYLRDHDSIDTQEFRDLCKALRNMLTTFEGNNELATGFTTGMHYLTGNNSEFILAMEPSGPLQRSSPFMDRDDLIAVPITGVKEPSVATCVFVSVNPNSKNLKNTLEYITALSRYSMNLQNSCVSSDRTKYSDSVYMQSLYDVYSNAEVIFQFPYDILQKEIDEYLYGDSDLEEMIQEGERKMRTYFNE
jgi:hypothetical protein